MYTITKEWAFEAAHHLPSLPVGHKCRNPHGHSYRVTIELQARDLDEHGFVIDFGRLGFIGEFINAVLDHRDLNTVFEKREWGATTSENIAFKFWEFVAPEVLAMTDRRVAVYAVTVRETAKTSATYRNI